jgi:hypothetical protein
MRWQVSGIGDVMPKPSRLMLARSQISSFFSESTQKVFSQRQLASILKQNRTTWNLAAHTTADEFISFLTSKCGLLTHTLRSAAYGHQITRHSCKRASPYEVALSIKSNAYLCHGTAAVLHGLCSPTLETIFLNAEQSPKPSPGKLTQEGIDRAFAAKQRQSNLTYQAGTISVTVIAGKNTKRFGVQEIKGPNSETLAVTSLARTLIDIVVRPAYAGGIQQVIHAYHSAIDRVSVDELMDVLKKLDYIYPYHQAIGFVMQQAGFAKKAYGRMREPGLKHDFYVAHCMQQRNYSEEWRLYYPTSLNA